MCIPAGVCVCSVTAGVGGVTVVGIPRGNRETVMVTSTPRSGGERLVDFSLELNPLDRDNMDVVVMTTVNPLKIVYDEVSEDVPSY